MKDNVYKSAGFNLHRSPTSSCSETSNLSSSDSSDTPLKRFNRLLRTSVARRWAYIRKKPRLWVRGRSVSDTGLCSILNHETNYLEIGAKHCSLLMLDGTSRYTVPSLFITSAGSSASAHGPEEASDSDAERPRTHHLRVPTPHYLGQSTGNFAASAGGAAGGGCVAPRSAPATPLQLEPHTRAPKHDKHVMKPLSGSAPSVRVTALAAAEDDAAEGKVPSKSRQKKFQRHFPQVGPDERVLNYYSCALVGDLLLQGHLYITKNYFAFYSNVFGYVTKLLIPTTSVLRITKEKVARIIPNAVGVCTRDERHVFGSLLSRDATYKLMMLVWKAARVPELAVPPPQVLRASGVVLDASEYSPEDDSSSACAEPIGEPRTLAGGGAVGVVGAAGAMGAAGPVGGAAVIQPALLTGGVAARRSPQYWRAALAFAAALLACSAALLTYRLLQHQYHLVGGGGGESGGEQLYAELVRWRSRLHGRAADELHAFLNTNLLLLTKVRQSLEALSGVILTDMGHEPADTAFS